jgi:hypothetical protein
MLLRVAVDVLHLGWVVPPAPYRTLPTDSHKNTLLDVLTKSIATRAFPGAVAMVGHESGTFFDEAVGSYTYGKVSLLPSTPFPFTLIHTRSGTTWMRLAPANTHAHTRTAHTNT